MNSAWIAAFQFCRYEVWVQILLVPLSFTLFNLLILISCFPLLTIFPLFFLLFFFSPYILFSLLILFFFLFLKCYYFFLSLLFWLERGNVSGTSLFLLFAFFSKRYHFFFFFCFFNLLIRDCLLVNPLPTSFQLHFLIVLVGEFCLDEASVMSKP